MISSEERAVSTYENLERENRNLTPAEWVAFLQELMSQCRSGIAAALEDLRRG